MKIAFRVDASPIIGSGHLSRCITLGTQLKESGNEINFICEENIGNFSNFILKKGFNLFMLPSDNEHNHLYKSSNQKNEYANWISVGELEDARRTIDVIKTSKEKFDWMIVDHYSLNNLWERELSSHVAKIMVIEDLYDRKHECSILLNQNLNSEYNDIYKDLVPNECKKLLGTKYAMLDPIYEKLHKNVPHKTNDIKNILVYFGGADKDNLTGRTLDTLLNLNLLDIEINIVIPESHGNAKEIEKIALVNKNIILHKGYFDLAPLMVQADFAIGAGGSTSWERCCVGLPSVIVAMSENQIPIAKALEKEGLIEFIGQSDVGFCDKLSNSLIKIFKMDTYENWSKRCKEFVDGKGVKRVAEAIALT